jgi:hypothetical protein
MLSQLVGLPTSNGCADVNGVKTTITRDMGRRPGMRNNGVGVLVIGGTVAIMA